MAISNLWVIMPVYNEEEAIEQVVEEWVHRLNTLQLNYTLCILNDGSKDGTLSKLKQLAEKHSRIFIYDKANSGHGQTCVFGYKLALEKGADWIFQIDSDGQCDPKYFDAFIPMTDKHACIYGVRKTRDDGMQRIIVSYFVTLFVFVATGQWLRDPNVPYRLIRADIMKSFVDDVPADFHLANIYVTVRSHKASRIKWMPIHFRDRMGGTASVKTFSFVKHGFKLFRQLKEAQKQ
ncbi:MAG: glycosyltransferase family 2 protein [Chitinophagaceae bacterium]|nr:glycosyltransferase family 2 protein [Chitinophagaceae bacterium]